MNDAGRSPAARNDASSWAEKRYHRLFETMANGAVYQDADGAIIDANPAAERLLGMTVDQMKGITSLDPRWRAVHEDFSPFPGEEHPAMVTLRTGKPVQDVVMGIYRPSDGRYVWLLVSAQPEFEGQDDRPTGVFATFIDISERRRVETELRRRRELEELLADVATSYIHLPPERLDDAIQDTMDRLGEYIGADRFYVFSYDWDAYTTSNSHEWCAEGISPEIEALQDVPLDAIRPWVRTHRAGRTMRVDDVGQLPEDDELRRILEPQGIQSLITVPIMLGEACEGFVGLDAVRERRDFTASEERLLRVFAQTIANVTQRKAAVEQLREQQRFLSDIIENSGAVVFVKDLDGRYVVANRTWTDVTGHAVEASLGRTDDELFDPPTAERFRRNDVRVVETGEMIRVEERLAGPDGTDHDFLVVKFPMRDNAGRVTGVCGMATDVTQLKQAEEAVRRSEARTRTVLDSVPAGLVAARAEEGTIVFANTFLERIMGFAPGQAVGRSIEELHPPEALTFIRERFGGYARGATTAPTRELPVQRQDGSRFLADLHVASGELDEGPVLFGVFSDVTEAATLKRQERARTEILSAMVSGEALRSVQQRVVELLETTLPDAIASVLMLDDEGRTVATSFGPGLPASFNDGLVGARVHEGEGPFGTAAATRRGVYVADVTTDPDGSVLRDAAAAADLRACWSEPIVLASGQVVGTVVTYFRASRAPNDGETHQLRMAADLLSLAVEQERGAAERVRRLAAEAASRSKSAFLANMSHEIRTPLNAVIGFAQILEWDDALDERQREQVRSIARSGEHLLRLINDVLDLSKIEAGHVQVQVAPVHLRTLLEDVAAVFAFRAEAKGLSFDVELDDAVPPTVVTDASKLRQVLVNLVGNAVKFTDRGGVTIRAGAHEPGRSLVIEVEDSGPGMTADELAHVFDSFQQGEAGRSAGGTGLGLAISRRLADLLGGTVTADSEPGRGSRFRVIVPTSDPADADGPGSALGRDEPDLVRGMRPSRRVLRVDDAAGPIRVLSVDDKEVNRVLLRDMLERVGFEVRDAADGAEAVQLFESWHPHLVLMDMRMPVMDGYEATRRIKAAPGGVDTPVVAVTASAFEDDEHAVFAAGVDGYVRKPFHWDDFFAEVARASGIRFVHRDAPAGDVPAGEGPATPSERPKALPPELRPMLQELARLLEQDDVAAQDVIDEVRAALVDALGPEGETLVREVKGFAFPDALVTLRGLLEQSDD